MNGLPQLALERDIADELRHQNSVLRRSVDIEHRFAAQSYRKMNRMREILREAIGLIEKLDDGNRFQNQITKLKTHAGEGA